MVFLADLFAWHYRGMGGKLRMSGVPSILQYAPSSERQLCPAFCEFMHCAANARTEPGANIVAPTKCGPEGPRIVVFDVVSAQFLALKSKPA